MVENISLGLFRSLIVSARERVQKRIGHGCGNGLKTWTGSDFIVGDAIATKVASNMSESDKEGGDPSSVSSIPPLLTDDGTEESGKGSVYRYRDFSHVGKDDDGELAADNPPPPPTAAARGNSESSIRVQKFPVKLYAILGQREFNDIISWMPHGRSWKVLKPNLFESMVMPLFFEYSNYHSFNRLVNAWSFRRISSGPDRGSYYHEVRIYF